MSKFKKLPKKCEKSLFELADRGTFINKAKIHLELDKFLSLRIVLSVQFQEIPPKM